MSDLNGPGLQPKGGVPEHPLELSSPRESRMHAGIERPGHSAGGGVGRRDHRAHGGMEILACVGVDPSLVRIGSCGAGVNVAPHFRINET